MAAGLEKAKADLALRNLEFVQEETKLHGGLKAKVATPNVVRLGLRTMALRDYGRPGGMPTLVNAPYAGHRAMIADYHKGQSLVETLLAGGVGHVALTGRRAVLARRCRRPTVNRRDPTQAYHFKALSRRSALRPHAE